MGFLGTWDLGFKEHKRGTGSGGLGCRTVSGWGDPLLHDAVKAPRYPPCLQPTSKCHTPLSLFFQRWKYALSLKRTDNLSTMTWSKIRVLKFDFIVESPFLEHRERLTDLSSSRHTS